MLIEYKRWVELLKLTPQDNNWKHLHIRFQTDNSYYREMKDYIDHVLNEFVEDDDEQIKANPLLTAFKKPPLSIKKNQNFN